MRPSRNPGVQEKVEVVEQVLTMKLQVGPKHLSGIWESRGSRGSQVFGGLEEPRWSGERLRWWSRSSP